MKKQAHLLAVLDLSATGTFAAAEIIANLPFRPAMINKKTAVVAQFFARWSPIENIIKGSQYYFRCLRY